MTLNRRDFVSLAAALPLAGCASGGTGSRRRGPVIDAHCHAGSGMNAGKEGAAPWTTYNGIEGTLRRMDEVGIDRTVLFPISNTTYEKANEEIAGFVRRHPDRFIGFAKHDPVAEAGRIRELLTREVRELGLRGLKLHQVPTREVLDVVAELRIPVLFHPPKVDDFNAIAQAYPQITYIMAHLGSFASRDWKEHVKAIEAAKRYSNVYLETSSVVFFEYLEQAARELPAEKLIFGSDGPLLDCRVELYKVNLLRLPREREDLVLGGNISRLLG